MQRNRPFWTSRARFGWPLLVLTLIVCIGLLAACGRGGTPGSQAPIEEASDPQTQTSPQTEAPENPQDGNPQGDRQSDGFPVTVTGDDGVAVTIERRPERIISIAPSNTEILFAIGAGDQVVGIDSFSDYPEEALDLPRLGGVTDPDFEMMASLQPDLALSIGGTDQIVEKLRELGVPVLVLQPETMDELYDTIVRAGLATGHREEAEQIVQDMQQRVAAITAKTDALSDDERPGVFYVMWPDPLMTAGPGSFIHDLITLAGGRNIAADAPTAFAEFSHEQVVSRNPDVILVPGPWQAEEADRIKRGDYPGWTGLSAVTSDRVHVVTENHVTRPGPRLIEGLEQFARLFHPELFD